MQNWKLKYLQSYDEYLKEFIKTNYKKNKKGAKEFLELHKCVLDKLKENPYINEGKSLRSKQEPLPSNIKLEDGIVFYKLYFKLPELKGSAEKGRLLYIVDENKKEIWLMYVYSHKQFEKRPSDSFLKKLIRFIFR